MIRQQSPGVETGALVAVGAATPSVDVQRSGRQRAGAARADAKVARLRHALAERVVTTDQRIQRELRGEAPLTVETVEECTRLLGLTVDEVLDGATVREPSLFDAGEVLEGSDPWWRGPNLSVIETLAASGVDFAADHSAFDAVPEPPSPNHLGALFRVACCRGLIECVGMRPSSKPSRRGGLLRVWRGVRREPS